MSSIHLILLSDLLGILVVVHSGMLDTNVLDKNAVGLVCPLFGDQGQPIG